MRGLPHAWSSSLDLKGLPAASQHRKVWRGVYLILVEEPRTARALTPRRAGASTRRRYEQTRVIGHEWLPIVTSRSERTFVDQLFDEVG